MSVSHNFDTYPNGNIITRPFTGYTIVPVADTAILARLEYAENDDQLRAGTGKAVQLILTPPQALDLADVLTRHANRILGQNISGPKN
jgi:hypothetical protein